MYLLFFSVFCLEVGHQFIVAHFPATVDFPIRFEALEKVVTALDLHKFPMWSLPGCPFLSVQVTPAKPWKG